MDQDYLASLELVETFIAESSDFLDEIELQLLALADASSKQGTPDSVRDSLMNNVFRLIHTIKGSAGSFGFKTIAALAHKAENLLDAIRKKTIKLEHHRLQLLQQAIDLFRVMLSQIQQSKSDKGGSYQDEVLELVMKLEDALIDRQLDGSDGRPAMTEVSSGFFVFEDDAAATVTLPSMEVPTFTITEAMKSSFLQESEETLQKVESCLLSLSTASGTDRNDLLEEAFRRIHSFKGNCGFMGYADLAEVTHAFESHLEQLKKNSKQISDSVTEGLFLIVDSIKQCLTSIGQTNDASIENKEKLLASLEGKTRSKSVSQSPNGRAPEKIESPEAISLKAAKPIKENETSSSQTNIIRNDIRVDLRKLDALINLVGELIIAEAMVSGSVKSMGIENEGLDRAFHHLRRTTLDLQDISMSVRMVPVAQTFRKMTRLVYDATQKMGKKARLILKGEDTEVDKTVIEQIADPIVHCVRNSIDHGLETPEARLASGKDEMGTITLEARHEESEIWIIIKDDGGGLRRDRILKRARERNLPGIEREATLTDSEVFNYIFEPGFSTAEQVTDISGRGVGMDVVRKNIEKIKGRVRIESHAGQGTSIIFQIPITLAIVDGMLIRVEDAKFTIPLLLIQESIRLSADKIIVGPDGQKMVNVRSDFIPVVQLGVLFGNKHIPSLPDDALVVIVESNGNSFALHVDEILGQQQTVIKPLPQTYKRSHSISGCTILGNGEVSLILDIGGISSSLDKKYKNFVARAA